MEMNVSLVYVHMPCIDWRYGTLSRCTTNCRPEGLIRHVLN